jgi:hypothetical protein
MSPIKFVLPALAVIGSMAPLAVNAKWLDDHNHHQTATLIQTAPVWVVASFSRGRAADFPSAAAPSYAFASDGATQLAGTNANPRG